MGEGFSSINDTPSTEYNTSNDNTYFSKGYKETPLKANCKRQDVYDLEGQAMLMNNDPVSIENPYEDELLGMYKPKLPKNRSRSTSRPKKFYKPIEENTSLLPPIILVIIQ